MPNTVSSREFNRNINAALRAAEEHPVVITDRDKPSHVLMSYEHYVRLTATNGSIVDMLGMRDADDIEFEPARLMAGELRTLELGTDLTD